MLIEVSIFSHLNPQGNPMLSEKLFCDYPRAITYIML